MTERPPRPFLDTLDSLEGIHGEIWAQLNLATKSARHGWHLPILGTEANGRPELRAVVLREVRPEPRQLICHTDRRSAKVRSIAANPNVAWLFYDAPTRVQLRVMSLAEMHFDDSVATSRWRSSRLESRRCYLAPEAPGLERTHQVINLPDELRERIPTESEAEHGCPNFAAIVATVRMVDFLTLRSTGNVAARFVYDDNGLAEAVWLTA